MYGTNLIVPVFHWQCIRKVIDEYEISHMLPSLHWCHIYWFMICYKLGSPSISARHTDHQEMSLMKLIRLSDNLIHVCTYSILLVILSSTSQQELCRFPFWQRSQVRNKTRTQLKFINLINTHSQNIKRLSMTTLPCFNKK